MNEQHADVTRVMNNVYANAYASEFERNLASLWFCADSTRRAKIMEAFTEELDHLFEFYAGDVV